MRTATSVHLTAVALLPFIAILLTAQRAAADGGLKAEIDRVLQERQEKSRTVHLEWTMIGRMPTSKLRRPEVLKAIRDRNPDIGEFVTFEQSMSLRLDGEKLDWRLETKDGETLRMPIGLRAAYDGEVSQEFSGRPLRKEAFPTGAVSNEKHAFGTNVLYIKPALLLYRPLVKSISGLDWSSCRILPDRVLVGERECVVAEYPHPENPLKDVYYFDEARGYVLARFQELVEDREANRIDVTYAEDEEHEFVPTSWVCTSFDGEGRFSSSRECAVTHFAINVPIPHEEFQIDFPRGTSLEDRRTGKTYQVGIAPAESRASDGAQNRRLWLSLGSLALFIVIAALIARSKIRDRTKRLSNTST